MRINASVEKAMERTTFMRPPVSSGAALQLRCHARESSVLRVLAAFGGRELYLGPLHCRADDPIELVGRGHVELSVRAVLGPLVGPPPHEVRGMAEAAPLHVIEGDFENALGAERLPGKSLVAAPSALDTRHALPSLPFR